MFVHVEGGRGRAARVTALALSPVYLNYYLYLLKVNTLAIMSL